MLKTGSGHPGEDARQVQLYVRHRIVTLAAYGHDSGFIAEHLGLPLEVVERVVEEEALSILLEVEEEREREF